MGEEKLKEMIVVRVNKKTLKLINEVVEEEGYSSVSEYLRDLIRRDLRARGKLPDWLHHP